MNAKSNGSCETQPAAASGGTLPIEREVKIAGVDLASVRQTLLKAGAKAATSRHFEGNWVLDRDRALQASERLLRVREQRDPEGALLAASLTVKVPVSADTTVPPLPNGSELRVGVKERIERETNVDDPQELLAALALLGYEPVRRYEKVRSSFRIYHHEVTLDETPIGDFVEVEGPTPIETAEALGLSLERTEVASYLALYDRHRQDHPHLGADMLFGTTVRQDASPSDSDVRGLPADFSDRCRS